MKKICMLFMLLFSMTVFASNINPSYTGTLNVTVDGVITTRDSQQIFVADNGNGTVTMTIPNFQFDAITGTVTIVANIAADGALSNPKVSFSGLPILRKSFYAPSYLNTSAKVHLNLLCLGKTIIVNYSGN